MDDVHLRERLQAHVEANEPPMTLTAADVLRGGRRARRRRRILAALLGAVTTTAVVAAALGVTSWRDGTPDAGVLVMEEPTDRTSAADRVAHARRLGGEVGARLDAAVRAALPDSDRLELRRVVPTSWHESSRAGGRHRDDATEWRLTYTIPSAIGRQELQVVAAYDYVWHLDGGACQTQRSLACQDQLYRDPRTDASDSFAGRPDNRTVPEEGQFFEAERYVGHTAGRRPDDIVVRTWATLTVEAASLDQARDHWVFSVRDLTDLVESPDLVPPEPTTWPTPLTKPRWWQDTKQTSSR